MATYAVVTKNGRRFVIGAVAQNARGYRFIPYCQHSPSRRDWPSPAAAVPRWARDAVLVEAPSVTAAMTAEVA